MARVLPRSHSWKGCTLSQCRGAKAWRAHWSLKSSAGLRLKVAVSLRLIRQLRTSRPTQRTGRLGSRKQSVSSISDERFLVPNLSLNRTARRRRLRAVRSRPVSLVR